MQNPKFITRTRLYTSLGLGLVLSHFAYGCSSDGDRDESVSVLGETKDELTVALPTPVAWWSLDEQCSTTTVYDSQPLPALSSGTKVNGATCVEGKIGRATGFDGVNDHINIPNKAAYQFSSAMTISAWAKPTGTTGTIAGKWGTQNSYRLLLSSGKFAFSVTLASGTVVTATATANASTTSFSHVAGTFDGAKVVLYVNGTQVASVNAAGTLKSSTDPIRMGNLTNNTNQYSGSIDELRVYGQALSSAQVNRLANGLQHRRFRVIAVDPKFTTETGYVGKRLHEHADYAPGWRSPAAVAQYWVEFLNAAAGERVYLPENGSYDNAVKYVEEVPWNNNGMNCPLTQGTTSILQTAEQYHSQGKPARDHGDLFRLVKANNPALGFDLVADANGQYFHELILVGPDDWGFGKEGVMAASPSDNSAFHSHDGIVKLAGLNNDKKFIFHGVSFSRDDRTMEQFWHRTEAILATAWTNNPVPSDACFSGEWPTGYQPLGSLSELRNAFDLFGLNERAFHNQAHVGLAHFLPNTAVEYVRTHQERIPSAFGFWANFPAGYPFDLTRNDYRAPLSCDTWNGCSGIEADRNAMIWQLSKLPKAEGTTDGRNNNWWMYVSNPNYQLGRGLPTTTPIVGRSHGAMDLELTVYADRIGLKWQTEVTGKGNYTAQRSTDRNTWTNIGSIGGSTGNFDAPRPGNGVDTFYRIAWNDGVTTRFSDQLGVNLGSATAINISGGQRPPLNPTISLLQQNTPYVHWSLPTNCAVGGLPNTVAQAPCALTDYMQCYVNVCRGGSPIPGPLCGNGVVDEGEECDDGVNDGGAGQCYPGCHNDHPGEYSDYHNGTARYLLEKRGGTFTTVGSVDRKPGWEGQYNHLEFSSADLGAAPNTVVGYRVSAYTLPNGVQGTKWGQTDIVLAVPATSTVGIGSGTGGTGGTGGAGGAGGSGGSGGAAGGGAGGTGGTGGGTEPCVPQKTITGGQSGNFGTAGPYCFRTPDNIAGWGCSNFDGRTLQVNDVTKSCGSLPLPTKWNGYYYFEASAGSFDYASIYWWQ